MADQQIDELSLKIEVKENDTAKTLTAISAAIDKLTSSLKGLSQFSALIDQLAKIKLPGGVAKAAKSAASAPKLKEGLQTTSRKISVKGSSDASKLFGDTGSLHNAILGTKKLEKNVKDLTKAQRKNAKETEKTATSWSKLTRAVGRIAFYRAIRSAIKEIAQTWREGLNNFVQYDEKTNKAMSDMMNSWTQIKNTIGVTAGYLMQTLAPIITTLADKVVDLLNNLNMALAKSQGKDEFAKAKKGADDYAKSLQKVNGQLLSFDTFTLGAKDEDKDDYDKGDVNAEWNNTAQTFLSIINLIRTISNSLKQIFNEIKPYIGDIIDMLEQTLQELSGDIADTIKEITPIIIDVVRDIMPDLIEIIREIIRSSNEFTKKLLPSIAKIIGSIIRLVGSVMKALAPVIDGIVEFLEPVLQVIAQLIAWFVAGVAQILEWIKPVFEYFGRGLKVIGGWLKEVIRFFKEDFVGVMINVFNKIRNFFKSVGDFFVNLWKNIANGFATIVNAIANGFIWVVNRLVDGINILIKPLDWLAGLFGKSGAVQIPHWNAHVDWKPYAEGGNYKTGDYFVANENGATEMIASTNNGGSVMNIDQWASISYSSFFRALSDYGAARDDGGNSPFDVDAFGRAIAGNRGFINEINRRNALNLR